MGQVSIHKEKSDSMLLDKAFRFSFCIVKIIAMSDGTCITVYENEKPNSVRTNRPLLEAIADENNKVSNILCTKPIELERKIILAHETVQTHRKSSSRSFDPGRRSSTGYSCALL